MPHNFQRKKEIETTKLEKKTLVEKKVNFSLVYFEEKYKSSTKQVLDQKWYFN